MKTQGNFFRFKSLVSLVWFKIKNHNKNLRKSNIHNGKDSYKENYFDIWIFHTLKYKFSMHYNSTYNHSLEVLRIRYFLCCVWVKNKFVQYIRVVICQFYSREKKHGEKSMRVKKAALLSKIKQILIKSGIITFWFYNGTK